MMTTNRVTAVFDNRSQAERAIAALRQLGITDHQVSVVSQHGDDATVTGSGTVAHDAGAHDDGTGERIGKGALAGAATGTLFGLAALAIPGVGPFITAGWLASALGVTGGAMAAGAIVGGTSGALAGLFAKAGYDEHEAHYYGTAVERGDVVVAVDTSGTVVSAAEVRSIMSQYGGQMAGGSTTAMAA
ncbi:MAG: hypothetical protein K0Q72_2370 [Armatimonadetes bacterium]|jgi:hypothetical protein|nr:hypothetical protein [Armatimonadota bacterium]